MDLTHPESERMQLCFVHSGHMRKRWVDLGGHMSKINLSARYMIARISFFADNAMWDQYHQALTLHNFVEDCD